MLGLARLCRSFEFTILEKAYGKKGLDAYSQIKCIFLRGPLGSAACISKNLWDFTSELTANAKL